MGPGPGFVQSQHGYGKFDHYSRAIMVKLSKSCYNTRGAAWWRDELESVADSLFRAEIM